MNGRLRIGIEDRGQKFPTGQIVVTQGALNLAKQGVNLLQYLGRHIRGDWGDLGIEDVKMNERSLKLGERLLSAYDLGENGNLWIITERDRSVTTLLLPEEY